MSSVTQSVAGSSLSPNPPSRSASRLSSSSGKGRLLDKSSVTPPKRSNSTQPRLTRSSTPAQADGEDGTAWGANFWVTLVDPQTNTAFYACPATGHVSWDAPVGNFVMPPSEDGEWWELIDESRGLPYYYQTKTGETVWEKPSGFVIPLGIIQNTTLGRRLSNRLSISFSGDADRNRRPATSTGVRTTPKSTASNGASKKPSPRRSLTNDTYSNINPNGTSRLHTLAQHLPPIPGSPYATASEASSEPETPTTSQARRSQSTPKLQVTNSLKAQSSNNPDSPRSKSSSYVTHRPSQPQSLNAAVSLLAGSHSDSGHASAGQAGSSVRGPPSTVDITQPTTDTTASISSKSKKKDSLAPPVKRATIAGRPISAPVLNQAAALELSPIKNRATGEPILVQPKIVTTNAPTATLSSGRTVPVLPHDLAVSIQQFSHSEYAKQYFSTHKAGFIFRRRIPVEQMMAWQKAALNGSLLALNKDLNRQAIKSFKIIQHLMGDRERIGGRAPSDQPPPSPAQNHSTASLSSTVSGHLLEEERWLLSEGLAHGELRDEVYCQLMKQLTQNPSTESVFKGWQLMCVLLITFPPSKNFEHYLRGFYQQHTTRQEGRVDVIAKYCLRRLDFIARKGPRGKPPTNSEIETASDAAFHPSTFGESLDAIIRLQERNYPHQQVPIILPFLADGILALGGTKAEGIFRVPGDNDAVSELKLRIDKGYYTLDGVDDPHVLASLMKLWLRELLDPLVPEEMYNECVASSKDPETCVHIVERLPTVNRRVILFVISFMQLFLDDRTQTMTKMTPANLALVMAPNLLRCSSDSMSVVFTNAQYEQIFVYNLLLHLKCSEVDPDYTPAHGLGAVPAISVSRSSKSRNRRN